jgi:hypothetical protein
VLAERTGPSHGELPATGRFAEMQRFEPIGKAAEGPQAWRRGLEPWHIHEI